MNSLIENLNQFGGHFLHFAWPMLWQSSLLIAFLFALDFLLARKIRASVRYALWLAVLVKLLLPPTLALPTGATWWLVHALPVVKAPAIRNYTVTYDTTPQTAFIPNTVTLPPPPPPQLNGAGWALLATGFVSAGLLLWLTIRWRQVARTVRGATAVEDFLEPLNEALRLAGAPASGTANFKNKDQHAGPKTGAPMLRPPMRLKLVEGRMSPAVCGLFRPVILLPRSLAEKLSPAQMRAVLLHEVFHLRRKDIWVNCAQALLQIVYWWHPLLWIANARIRRVREEAVDDAVMLTLRDEADSYAPTLLEVAKLALRRPLLSLGLVGIMESRSALRQRIERLVDFRAPRKAGLTFASLCGIFVFSAVALPMGEAPSPAEKLSLPSAVTLSPSASIQKTNVEIVLITASFYQMRADNFEKMASGLKFNQGEANSDSWWSASPDEFRQLTNNLELSGFKAIVRPRIQTHSGNPVDFYVGSGTSGTEIHCQPFVGNGLIDLAIRGQVVDAPAGTAIITKVAFTNQFSAKAKAENHGGIMIRAENVNGAVESNLVVVIQVEILANTPIDVDKRTTPVFGGRIKIEGVINDSNLNAVIYALEQRTGSNSLAEPQVTTTSGRGINKIAMPNISTTVAKMDAGNLVQDAKLLYEQGKLDDAKEKLKAALALDPENAAAKYYLGLVQTNSPAPAFLASEGRREILKKLNAIRLDNVKFDAVPLGEVLRTLAAESRKRDGGQRGINFLINPNPDPTGAGMFDPVTGLLMATNATSVEDLAALPITIDRTLTNASLADVLDAVVVASPKPIKCSIQDFGVVFSSSKPATALYSRHFRVGVKTFTAALRKITGMQTESVPQMAKSYFKTLGIDWDVPGKSVFFNDRLGELFVRATYGDLDKITDAIIKLDSEAFASQIHIKARFLEVPKGTLSGLPKMVALTNQPAPSNQLAGITGILTDEDFRIVLRNLAAQEGV